MGGCTDAFDCSPGPILFPFLEAPTLWFTQFWSYLLATNPSIAWAQDGHLHPWARQRDNRVKLSLPIFLWSFSLSISNSSCAHDLNYSQDHRGLPLSFLSLLPQPLEYLPTSSLYPLSQSLCSCYPSLQNPLLEWFSTLACIGITVGGLKNAVAQAASLLTGMGRAQIPEHW